MPQGLPKVTSDGVGHADLIEQIDHVLTEFAEAGFDLAPILHVHVEQAKLAVVLIGSEIESKSLDWLMPKLAANLLPGKLLWPSSNQYRDYAAKLSLPVAPVPIYQHDIALVTEHATGFWSLGYAEFKLVKKWAYFPEVIKPLGPSQQVREWLVQQDITDSSCREGQNGKPVISFRHETDAALYRMHFG